MKTWITGIFLLLLVWGGQACPVAAEGCVSMEDQLQFVLQVDGQGPGEADLAVKLAAGERFKIELIAAGGTGYLWQLDQEPFLVQIVQKNPPQSVNADRGLVGGPMKESYIFQAGSKEGRELLSFRLVRPWEDRNCFAKTLKLKVLIVPAISK